MGAWDLDRTREPRPRNLFGVVPPPFAPEPVSGCFLLADAGELRMWELVDLKGRIVARYGHCTLEEGLAEARRRGLELRI